jgi:outer membrane protein assembly factor BamB
LQGGKKVRNAILLVLMLTYGAGNARGDDWPQFRRDANRSAASTDELKFPLQERWSWTTHERNGRTPLYHATIRQGKVYFTASEKGVRSLICADAKTGKVQWKRALEAQKLDFVLSDIAGPSVTESGLVYAYDWMSKNGLARFSGQSATSSGAVEPMNSFCVRVFDAATGADKYVFPLAAMGANGVLPRLSLVETKEGQKVMAVPPTFVGCPP